MRYLHDLPSVEATPKMEQVKAYFNVMQNSMNPFYYAAKEQGCWLARESQMGQAELLTSIELRVTEVSNQETVTMSKRGKVLLGDIAARKLSHTLSWMSGWKNQCRAQMLTWHCDPRGWLSHLGSVCVRVHCQARWKDFTQRQWCLKWAVLTGTRSGTAKHSGYTALAIQESEEMNRYAERQAQ